eukprot:15434511-Alexandrium_andersonii.AAC.1
MFVGGAPLLLGTHACSRQDHLHSVNGRTGEMRRSFGLRSRSSIAIPISGLRVSLTLHPPLMTAEQRSRAQ